MDHLRVRFQMQNFHFPSQRQIDPSNDGIKLSHIDVSLIIGSQPRSILNNASGTLQANSDGKGPSVNLHRDFKALHVPTAPAGSHDVALCTVSPTANRSKESSILSLSQETERELTFLFRYPTAGRSQPQTGKWTVSPPHNEKIECRDIIVRKAGISLHGFQISFSESPRTSRPYTRCGQIIIFNFVFFV